MDKKQMKISKKFMLLLILLARMVVATKPISAQKVDKPNFNSTVADLGKLVLNLYISLQRSDTQGNNIFIII